MQASPLFQLQVLFASLETSNQSVYDPAPFVKSLRLDTTEQQDAQEFSKLFLDLLSREFKKQVALTHDGMQSVATLLADQVSPLDRFRERNVPGRWLTSKWSPVRGNDDVWYEMQRMQKQV